MEKLLSIDDYFKLVNQTKKEKASILTNCYFYPDKLQNLIIRGRIFFEKVGRGGVIFYVNEEEYYAAYYYLQIDTEWHIKRKDKDIVIKNIYYKDRKSKKITLLENRIETDGFYLLDELWQVASDLKTFGEKIEKPYRIANKILLRDGFTVIAPTKELIPQIREFQGDVEEIPIYQIPYLTDEEIISFGKKGMAVCIMNKRKELCAMKFFEEENSPYGYVAIKEEYQRIYGMIFVLNNYTYHYLKEKNMKPLAWIVNTNTKSINYHSKLGFYKTGRYMSEWVLKADNCKS